MSLVGLIVVCSIATFLGLAVALAFARAVLYANVLTELDDARELSRRLRRWGSPAFLREDRDADELGGSTPTTGTTPPRAPSPRSVVRLRSPAATSQENDPRGLALRV